MRKIPEFIWGRKWEGNYFRRCFWTRKEVKRTEIKIFVDTGYELFLNEQFIGSAQGFLIIKKFDITDKVLKGRNVVAIKAVNYDGHKGLVAELCVEYLDGEIFSIRSDATWKTFPEEKWGWKRIDFDDSHWDTAKIVGEKGREPWKLSGMDEGSIPIELKIPPFFTNKRKKATNRKEYKDIQEVIGPEYKDNLNSYPPEILFPEIIKDMKTKRGTIRNVTGVLKKDDSYACITVNKKNSFAYIIVDFGKEVVGYLRFKVVSPSACNIRLLFGETLAECYHEPPLDNLLGKMVMEDVILEPGRHEWEDSHRQGFRFVKISFGYCANTIKIGSVSVRYSLYPLEYTGYFSCSDKLLNRIWEIGRYTIHLCMQEYYLDGIKRDRSPWIGDTWLQTLVNYYTFGDKSLFKYTWYRFGQVQFKDGALPAILGEGAMVMWDYVAWWVISLYDYYMHTGDKDYVKLMIKCAIKATEWLISKMDRYNLIYIPKRTSRHQCFATLTKGVGEELNLNVLFYRALLCMSKMLCAVKRVKEAKRYEMTALRVKEAINQKLWSALGGRYFFCRDGKRYDETWQEGNALAIYFGVADLERIGQILRIQRQKHWTRYGPSEWPFLVFNEVEALFKMGMVEDAFELIKRCWGHMVVRGATTFWETIDLNGDGYKIDENFVWKKYQARSHCHGWSTGTTYSLQANVLGITPLSSGFANIRIAPQLGPLRWAKGVVPSPFGPIAVSYRKKTGEFHADLFIPIGTMASLVLPKPSPRYRIFVNGEVIHSESDDKHIYLNLRRTGRIVVIVKKYIENIGAENESQERYYKFQDAN